jgi:hypothetical protein
MVAQSENTILADYCTRLTTNKDDDFLTVHEEFIGWLASLEESYIEELEQEDYLAQYKEFFTASQRRYLTVKERQEVNLLLEKSKTIDTLLGDCLMSGFGINTYQRVQGLCQMVDFSDCQKCVMVGCGALPATLFYLYDRYPMIEYVGIDIDSIALAKAKEIIYLLGIEKIKLVESDGCKFDYVEAGMIYIANQVSPKAIVLKRIAETADPIVQVVMRDPTRRGKLLADCGKDDLPDQFSLVQKGNESQHFLSLDLFLRLRNGEQDDYALS